MNEKEIKVLEKALTEEIGFPFTYTGTKACSNCMYTAAESICGTIEINNEIRSVEADKMNGRWYWHTEDDDIQIPMTSVGSICLEDKVIVSDPAYERGTWCAAELENVVAGEWQVAVGIDTLNSWGKRVYILTAVHVQTAGKPLEFALQEDVDLGVDSGRMSIFSAEQYEAKSLDYCEGLFGNEDVEIIGANNRHGNDDEPIGVICSSGIGDGSYNLYLAYSDNKIVGIQISFL